MKIDKFLLLVIPCFEILPKDRVLAAPFIFKGHGIISLGPQSYFNNFSLSTEHVVYLRTFLVFLKRICIGT